MKNYLVLLAIIFNINVLFSQVGIGTTSPDDSSILDIESTNSGVLFPRLTTSQRDAIHLPATGLLIYNSSDNVFQYNIGTATVPNWVALENKETKSGTYNIGSTSSGWNYYNVTFSNAFNATPSIQLTLREGTGIDNSGSHTISHFKVANASVTGFTIAVYENSGTSDILVDWVATSKTQ